MTQKLYIKPLEENNFPEIYNFMKQSNFPDVPDSYGQARPFFEETINFGAFIDGQLKTGFIFGDVTESSAFLDIVCDPAFKGKWATVSILQEIYNIAFNHMQLKFIWVEARNSKSLRAALQAGFTFVTPLENDTHVLVLTKNNLRKRFLKQMENK